MKILSEGVIENEKKRVQRLLHMADMLEEVKIAPWEYALDIISAIENGRCVKLLAANISNDGVINGVNPDYVVEVPVKVSKPHEGNLTPKTRKSTPSKKWCKRSC